MRWFPTEDKSGNKVNKNVQECNSVRVDCRHCVVVSTFLLFLFRGEFHFIQDVMMNLYLSLGDVHSFRSIIQSFSPVQQVTIMSHTLPRLCQPHSRFHLVVVGIFFHHSCVSGAVLFHSWPRLCPPRHTLSSCPFTGNFIFTFPGHNDCPSSKKKTRCT